MKQLAIVLALLSTAAYARDNGQWEGNTPEIRQWFQELKQPDYPTSSCCGVADAYWADSYEVSEHGEYVAIITDERDDAKLTRPHIPVGTKIVVPNAKIKWDKGNPTGHGIIFVANVGDPEGTTDGWMVFCYLPPMGA